MQDPPAEQATKVRRDEIAAARAFVTDHGIEHVKVGVFDTDGILRGKYLSRAKFLSGLDKDLAFCDVILGWDLNDQLYDNVQFTGWHTAYPDATVRVLPATRREIPFEPKTALFLAEFSGRAETVCPRGTLRRVLERAAHMGYAVSAAAEFEFFMFAETPESVREKGYRHLKSMTPGSFGYSVLRNSVHSDLYHQLLDLGEAMRFPIEGLHTGNRPRCARGRAHLLRGARSGRPRGALQDLCQGARATPRAHGDVHGQMVEQRSGSERPSAHFAAKDERRQRLPRSVEAARHVGRDALVRRRPAGADAGAARHDRLHGEQLLALVPGFWAPTSATWGVENRTTALRVIRGGPSSQRVEYRIAAADINPYIALAAAIGSGLWGIEHRIEPDPAIVGNAYDREHPAHRRLPATLYEAAERLANSAAARALFGDAFVEHYAATRQWEEREFRKAITDWELARYFEII